MSKSFKTTTKLFVCGTAIALCLGSTAVRAQLDQQTGIADPGRAGESIRERSLMPQASPDIEVKQMALIGAPDGADRITFKFGGLRIEGNDIYSEETLSTIYGDKIGETITLADLYGIANEIAMKYRNDGYILTQVVIPPQTIESGLPRVQVVEGYIDQVSIQAPNESAREVGLIESYAGKINTGGALNIREMERNLLLINDLPGVTARAIISPSPTTAGAADMLIVVERDAFDAILSLDNYGSRYLGQWTLGAAATLNSIFNNNEALSAQAAYAPGTGYELLYGAVSYEQPIGAYGTRVGGLVSVTDTDPGFDLEQFDVRGHANLYSIYATHPIIRSRNTNLNTRLAFDWRDVKSSNNIEVTRKDHIRALRAGVDFDFLDTLLGVAVNSMGFQISQGLDIMGASDEDDANMTRPQGDPQFTKAELTIQRLQRITNSVNVKLSGKGQLASDALLSSEEFGVGGIYSGRGYDPSEIVGDDGIAGQVELQWNNPFVAPDGKVVEKFQLYSFLDAGKVWNQDATTSADKKDSLVSTGVGVRVDFSYDFHADVGVAFPLTRRIQTENDVDPRYYMSVSKKF